MGTFPYRRLQASSRNRNENTDKRKDGQLAGQSSSTLFMNIRDGYVNKKVTFETQDGLEEKIDELTSMMSKLATQEDSQNEQ